MDRRIVLPCVAVLMGLLAVTAARAQEPSPSPEPPRLQLHGFADVAYAYNLNAPSDGANFFAGVGTAAKRHDEISLNQGQIELRADPGPVGFRLAVGFGTGVEVVHAGEPEGSAVGKDVWRNVVYASATYEAPVGRGLLLEGGIFPCHLGFEAFNTKDNWNFTRSWLGELSPYYSTGFRASYPFSAKWTAQLHVLNGWQLISDNNSAKTLGSSVAYSSGRLTASFNTLAGPELAGNDDDWRLFGDVVATFQVTPSLALGTSIDVAQEDRPAGHAAQWNGVAGYVRFSRPDSKTALALRLERFDDGDGAISGTAQTLTEGTLTLEQRPTRNLFVKLEGRYDHSSAAVFGRNTLGPDGTPVKKQEQFLLLLGVVAAF